jgi:hypothetical protein
MTGGGSWNDEKFICQPWKYDVREFVERKCRHDFQQIRGGSKLRLPRISTNYVETEFVEIQEDFAWRARITKEISFF